MDVAIVTGILLFSNFVSVLSQNDFAYHGPTGPQYWPELWPEQCAGDSQSPIDILPSDTEGSDITPVVLNGYGLEDIPEGAAMQFVNNGHSVQINLVGDYHMEGGPLSSVYQADQLHFHWGSTDDQGSEHRIDEKQFAAEIHVVHYDREKYDNYEDAVLNENGLSVFSILIEVVEENNPAFDAVIQGLGSVTYRGDTYNFPEVFPIASLLPSEDDQDRYYFYYGSLTTPVCNEVVQWIVYKQPVQISNEQIAVFRTAVYENEVTDRNRTLVNNFRPTQPLNGRIVYSADASVAQPSLLFALTLAVSVLIIQTKDS